MGGKGGHKKQVTKKTLLASAASAAAAAKSSSPKVRPRPSPTGSGHSEYSESETEAPARAMELDAPTTAAIQRDLSKRGRLAAPVARALEHVDLSQPSRDTKIEDSPWRLRRPPAVRSGPLRGRLSAKGCLSVVRQGWREEAGEGAEDPLQRRDPRALSE